MPPSSLFFAIDSMALFYRSYFAMIRNPLINSRGLNTSGLRGVVQQILRILEEDKPEYLAVASDSSEPTFRHERFPAYKATREKMPEDLVEQLPYLPRLVEALHLPYLILPGYEADDIIGTLMSWCSEADLEGVMVTSDKDYMQLITDKITLLNHHGNRIGKAGVFEKFQCAPGQVIDILGLMGDSSDNVPGVKGVGEKTAIKLIQEFGSIDSVYKNLDSVSSASLRTKLENDRDAAFLSRELVTIFREVPLNIQLEDLKPSEIKISENVAFHQILEELEFNTLLKRLTAVHKSNKTKHSNKIIPQPETYSEQEISTQLQPIRVSTEIIGESSWHNWMHSQSITKQKPLAIIADANFINQHDAQWMGIALCSQAEQAVYWPFGKTMPEKLRDLLQDATLPKIVRDTKHLCQLCKNQGVSVQGIVGDLMIAAHLTDSLEKRFDLGFLVQRRLQKKLSQQLPDNSSVQLSMLTEPNPERADYFGEWAAATLQLWEGLSKQLRQNHLTELFQYVELPLAHCIAEMEYEGIRINTEQLSKIADEFEKRLNDLRSTVHAIADSDFNLNSVVELQEVLYKKFKLHEACGIKPKKIKLGIGLSTDEETLEKMSEYPLPRIILDYRSLNKLKNTYIDQLPTYVHPKTQRIHSTFHQVSTATGRLSSDTPNLQNIPIRSAEGRRIRKVFLPSKSGNQLLAADYSQIELRVAAHYSKDPTFLDAYRHERDIHSLTASAIFQVTPEEVTREQRSKAKEVNFGLIYRMGPDRLSIVTQTSKAEAKVFIEAYFQRYSTIHALQEHFLEKARKEGYANTLLGRRRLIPDINGKGLSKRLAEGAAINTPIQGSAAEIIKLAMISVNRRLQSEEMDTRMVLSIHDELVFDVPEAEIQKASLIIKEEMENVIVLEVPLVVEIGLGDNWLEAH
jgi:DNA polymerase-1